MIPKEFPSLSVIDSEYPTPKMNQLLSWIVRIVQVGAILIAVLGDKVFGTDPARHPGIYTLIRDRKMICCFLFFFIGNSVCNFLTQTGAFEVFLDEKLLFSKLATGRIPDAFEIIQMIKENKNSI